MDYTKRCRAVIDLDRIGHNFLQIRSRLRPDCMVMAAVKADAYGHGDTYIARELEGLGANWFGVSNLEEGLTLRRAGISRPILIFGHTPSELAPALAENDITQTVYCPDYAMSLHEAAKRADVRLSIHIKVDTGMTRIGFMARSGSSGDTDATDAILGVCAMPHFYAEGIYTHFSCADELCEDSTGFTRGQLAKFCRIIEKLGEYGIMFPIRHCCNSAGIMSYPEAHFDMVRPGIILYGLPPSAETRDILDLAPAMEWYSCVTMIKDVPDKTPISYGRTAVTSGTRRIATVAAGYADGYSRLLSNKGRMLVRGMYAPVVGRVCMDQLMLDVTGIPDVAIGDIVTIVGRDGQNALTLDELAELHGTINYETACLVGKRVPRIYRRNGREL